MGRTRHGRVRIPSIGNGSRTTREAKNLHGLCRRRRKDLQDAGGSSGTASCRCGHRHRPEDRDGHPASGTRERLPGRTHNGVRFAVVQLRTQTIVDLPTPSRSAGPWRYAAASKDGHWNVPSATKVSRRPGESVQRFRISHQNAIARRFVGHPHGEQVEQ
jgi:hypothetical protein